MYWNGWGWMWMGLMMILFWGGLIVLVALLLRGRGLGGHKDQTVGSSASGPDATEILRARFARGEITEDEYRKSLKVLDETKRSRSLPSKRRSRSAVLVDDRALDDSPARDRCRTTL